MVLHPPCGRWCRLAPLNERRWGAKVGDDGGLFAHALATLLRCGGVLEHPAYSIAWREEWFGLPRPGKDGWACHDTAHGELWVCEVWQSAYGHPAHKKTWLLYRGSVPPLEMDWRRDKSLATHQIGGGVNTGQRSKPRLADRKTHLSPPAFARALVELARHSTGGVDAFDGLMAGPEMMECDPDD